MNNTKLIIQPDDGLQPVVDFLRSATKTVVLKQFTFTHPLLLKEIMALHRKGIQLRVILNGAKATGERLNDPFFETMKSANVAIKWSNPAFLVTHEKSIVVDDKKALLATFNFMEKYFQATRDYGVLTNDRAQVEQLRKCFDLDWDYEPFHPPNDTGLVWSPGNARQLVCELVDTARKTIKIQHPKFAEPVLLERILEAMRGGVRVQILCGGKHGLHHPDMIYSFALWRLLHQAGAKVHKQKNLRVHAKLLIVEQAFDLRREAGIIVRDEAVVVHLANIFAQDWASSNKYEPPHPMEYIAEEEEGQFTDVISHE